MEKVKDTAGNELNPGDHVVVQGWRGLEVAKIRRFTSSCMLCDYTFVNHMGDRIPSRLQPYLPDRMIKVLKITQQQYDNFQQNL